MIDFQIKLNCECRDISQVKYSLFLNTKYVYEWLTCDDFLMG